MRGRAFFKSWLCYVGRTALGAILMALAAMAVADGARAQTMAAVGDRGDRRSPDHCQGPNYLVGFVVRSGDWLNQIGIICSPVDANGRTGAPSFGPLRGGNGGSPPHNVTCQVNEVAVGVLVHLTSDKRRVRGIGLDCKNAKDVGRQGLGRIVNLGNSDTAAVSELCNPGNSIVEVDINNGADVNGIGVVCGSGPKIAAPQTSSSGSTPPGSSGLVIPKATSVSSPATIGVMTPGQVLAKDGCPAPAAAKVPPAQGDNDSPSAESAIGCLINAERTARNLSPLTVNSSLMSAISTEGHAAVTLKWWHDGASPHINPQTQAGMTVNQAIDSRVRGSGYCGGSNKVASDGEIAYDGAGSGNYSDDQGQPTKFVCLNGCGTPTAAVDWWMNVSAQHRKLILTPGFTHLGIVAIGDMGDPKNSSAPARGLYIVDFGSCQ